jgi:hypothetical protein
MTMRAFFIIGLCSLQLSGCVNVEPAKRSFLARDDMQLDPDYLGTKFRRHMYFAREATPGRYGPESSGCGCN